MEVHFDRVPIVWSMLIRGARKSDSDETITLNYMDGMIKTGNDDWKDLSVKSEEMPISELTNIRVVAGDQIHFTWSAHPERQYIIFPPPATDYAGGINDFGGMDDPLTTAAGCGLPAILFFATLVATAAYLLSVAS